MPFFRRIVLSFALLVLLVPGPARAGTRTVTDALGRQVTVPETVEHVICSGPGCLRLLTYLQAQDRIMAVDDMEGKRRKYDARPYALAQPQFKDLPVFGEFRGCDHPERIVTLKPLPQVIFKVYNIGQGMGPAELQDKTGIPVVALTYGTLSDKRDQFYGTLRLMGRILGTTDRAEALVRFFESRIADLSARTKDIPEDRRPTAFVGGIAYRGPHGFASTEPFYPPFRFVHAKNVAAGGLAGGVVEVAKEKIVAWNPDVLFLDLATLQMGDQASGLHELATDPAYTTLAAVAKGRVYGVLPYNWYNTNYGSLLANAYFIGKVLSPERFADIDPVREADAIYTFLVGKPEFAAMDAAFAHLAFKPVPLAQH